jgi:anti-sigma regulatory factor (Ser/Thr protein kinase)
MVDPLALAYCWQKNKASGAPFPLLESAHDDVLAARIALHGVTTVPSFHPLTLAEYEVAEMDRLDEWMERWRRSVRLAIPSISAEAEHDVTLACREAVLNALEHGCRESPQYPVTLQIGYRPHDGLLRAWVQDPGPGHDKFLETPDDVERDEHFGLELIKRLPKAVKFAQRGASVTMDFAPI